MVQCSREQLSPLHNLVVLIRSRQNCTERKNTFTFHRHILDLNLERACSALCHSFKTPSGSNSSCQLESAPQDELFNFYTSQESVQQLGYCLLPTVDAVIKKEERM